jgi:hypothetical protein
MTVVSLVPDFEILGVETATLPPVPVPSMVGAPMNATRPKVFPVDEADNVDGATVVARLFNTIGPRQTGQYGMDGAALRTPRPSGRAPSQSTATAPSGGPSPGWATWWAQCWLFLHPVDPLLVVLACVGLVQLPNLATGGQRAGLKMLV